MDGDFGATTQQLVPRCRANDRAHEVAFVESLSEQTRYFSSGHPAFPAAASARSADDDRLFTEHGVCRDRGQTCRHTPPLHADRRTTANSAHSWFVTILGPDCGRWESERDRKHGAWHSAIASWPRCQQQISRGHCNLCGGIGPGRRQLAPGGLGPGLGRRGWSRLNHRGLWEVDHALTLFIPEFHACACHARAQGQCRCISQQRM
jgi:hypothetical protein